MTNREYLTKSLAGLGVTADDIEVILAKAGIDPDVEAVARTCDLAVYKNFSAILKNVGQNVTEGGYSVSWNWDAIKLFYRALADELGLEDVLTARPKVRDRSNLW